MRTLNIDWKEVSRDKDRSWEYKTGKVPGSESHIR